MAFKGTAAKSASGASMSKYDVEVESRLSKLEEAVASLQKDAHPKGSSGGGGDVAVVVEALKSALEVYNATLNVWEVSLLKSISPFKRATLNDVHIACAIAILSLIHI